MPALNLGLETGFPDNYRRFLSPFLPYLTLDGVRLNQLKKRLQINLESNRKQRPFSFHSYRAGQIHTVLYNPWNIWSRLNEMQVLLKQLRTDRGTEFYTSGRTGFESLVEHRSKELQCTVLAHTTAMSDFFFILMVVILFVERRPLMGLSVPTDDR